MFRTLTAFIISYILALPAVAFDVTDMSDKERAIFRDEIRSYLMENPKVIMEAVAVLEQRQGQEQMQADIVLVTNNAEQIFNDGYSFVGGNPEGDITLVEFVDYRCGYCKKAHGEVTKLLKTDGNIRIILKEFPILGEQSLLASRFAIATKQISGAQAYKGITDALMTFEGEINMRNLRRLASTFGLDADGIEAQMDSPEVMQEIAQTRTLAQQLQISGTPTFIMQDELLRGYLPYDQMKELIDAKRG
ncbi:MAG: DsbA family protein [Tateyamaria sp.]|nr:DsbA family protein [Tateyamaria sp.]MDG1420486.1 DsbA family protein [Tateyamaria sp.]